MTQLRKAVLTGCLPKMRDFQCSATTVLSGECTEFQRKRGERESSLGVAPHAQNSRGKTLRRRKWPLQGAPRSAEKGTRKTPGGGSDTAI